MTTLKTYWDEPKEVQFIRDRLIAARLKANMTMKDTAESTGLNKQTIAHLEHARHKLDVMMILRLCKAYSVDFTYILTGKESNEHY